MSFWQKTLAPSKMFLILISTWVLVLVVILGFAYHTSPQAVDFNQFEKMIQNKELLHLNFETQSQELLGRAKDKRIVFRGVLPKTLFLSILQQNISDSAFLGPVSGFGEKSEFEDIRFQSPNDEELLTYEISAMGLNAGRVEFRTRSFEKVNSEKELFISVKLETRPEFSIYSVNDLLLSTIHLKTESPDVFEHRMQQSQLNGVQQIKYSVDGLSADYLQEAISSKSGLSKEQKTLSFKVAPQNAASIFYRLRTLKLGVGESETLFLHDNEKVFSLKVTNLGPEIAQSKARSVAVTHLQVSATTVNQMREPILIDLLLGQEKIPVLLSVEAKTKIGSLQMHLVDGPN
jgi:hypothetical protein